MSLNVSADTLHNCLEAMAMLVLHHSRCNLVPPTSTQRANMSCTHVTERTHNSVNTRAQSQVSS